MDSYSITKRHQPCTSRIVMQYALITCLLWVIIPANAQTLQTADWLSAAMAGDRLTVFARSEKSRLTHRYYDQAKGSWTDWIELGQEEISSGPSAVMASDRLTVFARALNWTLVYKYFDPIAGTWTNWLQIGEGEITSAPSAVMADDRLTVFARNAHGKLVHKYFDPQAGVWTNWIQIGEGEITSAPSAIVARNRLTVFARTAHGTLTHKYYDSPKGWTDWIHLGDGQISSQPSVIMAGDRLTVFARTAHGTLTHKYHDSQKGWTDWIHFEDGIITSGPFTVVANNRLTVFARSIPGELMHQYYDPVAVRWTGWIEIGGSFGGPIAAREVDDLIVPQSLKQGVYNATAPHLSKGTSSYPFGELVLIPVETLDSPRNTALTRQYIENAFFSPCGVGNYFVENSWATFQPRNATIADFVSVQKNWRDYQDPESGPQFKQDILRLANVDWRVLDRNNDRVISASEAHIFFINAPYRISNSGPWSYWASSRSIGIGRVQTQVGRFDFGVRWIVNISFLEGSNPSSRDPLPSQARPIYAHELNHAFFNLADKYAGYTGGFDIMSASGSWVDMTIYDRIKVGWIRPRVIIPPNWGLYKFQPSESWPDALILIDSAKLSEYWIIEYRSREASVCNYDSGLPESGVAVWWVKRNPFPASSAWANYDDLRLVQANLPDQDPDGSGTVLGPNNAPVPGPNPGYANQGAGSLFNVNNSRNVRTLFYSDGTRSKFDIRVQALESGAAYVWIGTVSTKP